MAHNKYNWGILTDTDVELIMESLSMLVERFGREETLKVMEVGVCRGKTSRGIKHELDRLRAVYEYWAVDSGAGMAGNVLPPFEGCRLVIGNSEESYMEFPDDLHWVFIDGCHCINHVMLDILHYAPKVRDGGLIVLHDTSPLAQACNRHPPDYQKHGPRHADFGTAILAAFDKLDVEHRRDMQLVRSAQDEDACWGGVSVFKKVKNPEGAPVYRGKEGQDRWAMEVLGYKRNGYFVDIGAHNGYNDSNSYVMEKYFDWEGICVEPNTYTEGELRKYRNCHIETSCISDVNGEVDFVQRGRRKQVSGIYHPDADEHVLSPVDQYKHPLIKKPSLTLIALLKKYQAPRIIDYLSVDVEGAEHLILQGFDFSRYKFLTLTIEHNYFEGNGFPKKNLQRRQKVQDTLLSNGYHLNKTVVADDWFSVWEGQSTTLS